MSKRPEFAQSPDWEDPPTAMVVPQRSSLKAVSEALSRSADPARQGSGWNVDAQGLVDDQLLNCLYEMTRLLGKPMAREALISGLPLEGSRLTPKLFVRAANRNGFIAQVSKHRIDRRMAPLCPAVALLSDDRAVIVKAIDRERSVASLVYPQAPGDVVEMPLADLDSQALGFILTVRNGYRFDERSTSVRPSTEGHWFWGAVFKPWRTYRDVLAASLLINVFALAVPLFTMNVYDRVIPNTALETLWTFAIGVTAILGFDVVMKVLRAHFIDLAGKRVDHLMASSVMAKVLNTRLEARPASVGSTAANLRSFESVREFLTSTSLGLLVDLPFALLFIGVIAMIGGWLVAPTVAAFALVIGLSMLAQARMKPLTEQTQRASQQRHSTLIEALVGIETIKALNIEGRTQKRWEDSGLLLAEKGAAIKLWSAIAVHGTAWIGQAVTVSTIIFGVYLIGDNALTMGALIACSQLAGRALAPLGQLSSLLVQYDTTRSAYQGVNRMMGQPEERASDQAYALRRRMKGAIEFQNVSFRYPGAEVNALDRVSFAVAAGERVALIGAMGSGKSTIEKLLLGLYQPTAGTIRFDGIDSQQIDPAQVRRAIGYVPQDVTLFFGTLRENICIAAPHTDDSTVLRAAAMAGLKHLIDRHPQGLNLPIGERGESLSGGQRQSVAIARALVSEPPILLLDEPSSAMDSGSETKVLNNLRAFSAGRTLLLVTHRMSMLELVDRIIVVDQGRVIADGPKAKVIASLKALS
jgi:ATP-binding cassette subfamily C protein LapB